MVSHTIWLFCLRAEVFFQPTEDSAPLATPFLNISGHWPWIFFVSSFLEISVIWRIAPSSDPGDSTGVFCGCCFSWVSMPQVHLQAVTGLAQFGWSSPVVTACAAAAQCRRSSGSCQWCFYEWSAEPEVGWISKSQSWRSCKRQRE